MTEKQALRLSRVLALAVMAVLAAYVLFLTNPHYNLEDDAILMYAMGGMVGGVVDGFNDYTHTFLRRLIQGLTLVWPNVAWFSVAQLGIVILSAYVTLESAMLAAYRRGLPLWLGLLAGAGCTVAFGMPASTSVTFTLTAAVAGAAAVWQLIAVDWRGERNRRRRELGRSLLLLALCLSIRRENVLCAGVFWFGVVIWLWKMRAAAGKALLRTALAGVMVLGAMLGVQALENVLSGEQAYLDWQIARSSAIDYGAFALADEALLEANNWTESELALAGNWCFLDEEMTTEALARLGGLAEQRFSLAEITDRFSYLLRRSRNIYWACALLAGLCLTALCRRRLWQWLASLCCGLAALAMLVYLACTGRLPMRAAASVLYPACAMGFGLALEALAEQAKGLWKWLRAAACLLLAALLFLNVRFAFTSTYNPYPKQTDFAHTRLEHYALAHPDELIIGTLELGSGWQLFPDWSAGKPDNLLLSWGSWNNHCAGYRAALGRFGYAHDAFRIEFFLDAPLRLATAQGESPPEALLRVMSERTQEQVEAILCHEENGFSIYRFEIQQKES